MAGRDDLLRFLTCGSVDDGKSTLLGRLLHDSDQVFDDRLAALARDSKRYGGAAGTLDLALLTDGLEAEREQGITIDVAYHHFITPRRAFIVADTPGHEQYTRNMATGASTSDVAVILVDARKGVLRQTKRHAAICSLLGIRHLLLAVNKMDLVAFDRATFDGIVADFAEFARRLGHSDVRAVPISAIDGDNVSIHSPRAPWYTGPTLLELLETIDVVRDAAEAPMRFLIQWINRSHDGFRGLSGRVLSGQLKPGDDIVVVPSGQMSRIASGPVEGASAGDSVTLTLAGNIDAARGDLLAPPTMRPTVADQFTAHIVWMAEEPLLPGRTYLMRIGARWVAATVTQIKHRLNVETLEHSAARHISLNEIAACNLSTAAPVAFDPYIDNRETGAFILVDRFSYQTAGAGMILHSLRRADNVHIEHLALDKAARAAIKMQKPSVIWFTGLSASGKSTIAKAVEARLHAQGRHTMMLDGDNLRHSLNRDLGFTPEDRVENIRRVGEVAKLMVEAGLIVVCAFISPYRAERDMVRAMLAEGEFFEVFVDTPIDTCIRRDPKGLYTKAKAGLLPNFTGIDSAYERPERPEITLLTEGRTPDELALDVLTRCGYTSDALRSPGSPDAGDEAGANP